MKTEQGFCTKYALTQGIFEVTIDLDYGGGSGNTYAYALGGRVPLQLKRGAEFFKTREEAETNAKQRAQRKAESLRRDLQRMEVMATHPVWVTK
jgi:hypothetical protein